MSKIKPTKKEKETIYNIFKLSALIYSIALLTLMYFSVIKLTPRQFLANFLWLEFVIMIVGNHMFNIES